MAPSAVTTSVNYPNLIPTLLFIVFYLVLLLAARRFLIVKPLRRSLKSQIKQVRADWPGTLKAPEIKELLCDAERLIERPGTSSLLLWSQGEEIAAWSLVHRVERAIYSSLPLDDARARLQSAVEELRPQGAGSATSLVKRTDAYFASTASGTPGADKTRALLREVLALVYEQRDREFAVLVTWHNKALWLIYMSLGLVLAASWIGGAQILLVGTIAGFLSRLGRVHRAENLPTDYGAYWTTLFLSPLVGALAAWGGFLLLAAFGAFGISLTGVEIPPIKLDVTGDIGLLGLAFVLGFSEMVFNGFSSALEGRVAKISSG